MSISIQNRQGDVAVPSTRLRSIAARALAAVGRSESDVHVAVVDDREIRRLNRRYLGARGATDVLAFALGLGSRVPSAPRTGARGRPSARRGAGALAGPSPLLGEVIVSAETAARQAARLGVPPALELELLLVHGVLHLAGYDDHAPADARAMHERTRAILAASRRRALPARLFADLLAPSVGDERRAARAGSSRARIRQSGRPLPWALSPLGSGGIGSPPSPSKRERAGGRVAGRSRTSTGRAGGSSRASASRARRAARGVRA